MGFLSLLLVASAPVAEVLLIALLGAYLASSAGRGGSNAGVLTPSARADINRVVYAVFTPALVLASLARTMSLQDAVSWWFMPVNIGVIFLTGGVLGWAAVVALRPPPHLRGLVVASCSAPNLGNLLLIVIPAVCHEGGNPFVSGDGAVSCTDRGLAYASFSMALGGFYIWTHTSSVMKRSKQLADADADDPKDQDPRNVGHSPPPPTCADDDDDESLLHHHQLLAPLLQPRHRPPAACTSRCWEQLKQVARHAVQELASPPTVGAVIGFVVGAAPWLRSIFVAGGAPLRVVQDSLKLLGDGTIPCVTLVLGGNLTKGVGKTAVSPAVVTAIIFIRYIALPVIGMAVVTMARRFGFLPPDPLYQYVLMLQFTLPPAMSIGTIAQLYDVAQEECSVVFLWTYVVAALALTAWSTLFMSILTA